MMKFHSLLCGLMLGGALYLSGNATGQTPPTPIVAAQTPLAAVPTPLPIPVQPLAATPAAITQPGQQINSAAWQALEPVRQAIAQRDYPAAQLALDNARRVIPNDPTIAVYDNLIRQATDPAAAPRASGALLRTPRPGVTPLPVEATPTPTPEPVIAATPAPEAANQNPGATTAEGGSDAIGRAKTMWDTNPMVKYGAFGFLGLLLLLIVWAFMRRRITKEDEPADISEEVTPVPGSLPSVSAMDYSVDELSAPSAPAGGFDFSPVGDSPEFTPTSGLDVMGSNMAGNMGDSPAFTTFGLDDEEHSAPSPAPVRPAPAPVVDDDEPVRFHEEETVMGPDDANLSPAHDNETIKFHDQETVISFDPSQTLSTPATVDPDMVSFGDMGMDSGSGSAPSATPLPAAPEPKPAPKSHFAPTAAPGTVNLDDIFGAQGLPGADSSDEDPNSQTVPTFVSKPGIVDPLDSQEKPPTQNRPASTGETSISFEELFGPNGGGSPAAQPTPTPSVPAAPETPSADISIEDALAAALGDMKDTDPDATPAPKPFTEATSTGGTESLDERTERMYNEQMGKARAAMAEKNWRQAVHVLSIASALHPDDEEARQMLREARAEKRKSEESV